MAVTVAVKTGLQLAVAVNILPDDFLGYPCIGLTVAIGILIDVNLVGLVGVVLDDSGVRGVIGLGYGIACYGVYLDAAITVGLPDTCCFLGVEGQCVVVAVVGLP